MKRAGGLTAAAAVEHNPVGAGVSDLDPVFGDVEAYYSARLAEHGVSPAGVDWSCQATQWLRFVQLLKLCAFGNAFSLNDLGCGYGELAAFMSWRYPQANVDYLGVDLSGAMVRCARRLHRGEHGVRFAAGRSCGRQADYTVASGIMNVMVGYSIPVWERFLRAILVDMYRTSSRGFAVNFFAPPPPGVRPDQLYCSNPEPWVRFCEDDLGCSVELLDDYGLREFTLLIRRSGTR
jgi:SAM-dependent methyltransferase